MTDANHSKQADAIPALDVPAGSARPLYASTDFKEYCAEQKAKGLNRSLWRHLPEMWEDELQFRADFEEALAKAGSPPNTSGQGRRAPDSALTQGDNSRRSL